MDYEQAYKDAMARCELIARTGLKFDPRYIFPELTESEDERIRKTIESIIRVYGKTQGEWIAGYDMDTLVAHLRNAFAYLEKQREQKPSTPEDIAAAYQMGLAAGRKEQKPLSTEETELNSIAFLEQLGYTCVPPGAEQKPAEMDNEEIELSDFESELFSAFSDGWQQYLHGEEVDVVQWAKEHSAQLLDAAKQELKPAEWSEEDKRAIDRACVALRAYSNGDLPEFLPSELLGYADRLQSLRPQPHWKPSGEQMNILDKVYHYLWADRNATADMQDGLGDFIDDLKKLL